MTTIAGVQHDGWCILGADSQVTANRKYSHPKMAKITQRGQYLIAGAGLSSFCDVAQHIFHPPRATESDKKDLYHFMISKFIPALKKCFKENDLKLEDDKDEEPRFAFLVAINGMLFDIADDFAVSLDADGYYGIGSGSNFAIGALKSGANIKKALMIAADKDPYTSAPFIFMEQHG